MTSFNFILLIRFVQYSHFCYYYFNSNVLILYFFYDNHIVYACACYSRLSIKHIMKDMIFDECVHVKLEKIMEICMLVTHTQLIDISYHFSLFRKLGTKPYLNIYWSYHQIWDNIFYPKKSIEMEFLQNLNKNLVIRMVQLVKRKKKT